jgi:hypothetical protein
VWVLAGILPPARTPSTTLTALSARALFPVSGIRRVGTRVFGVADSIGVMSYDLAFWRRDKPVPETAAAIYQRLISGDHVGGLADLDVESFLAAVVAEFPGAVRETIGETDLIEWTAVHEQASFQVEWSRQHVVVFCRRTTNEDMNRLIKIAVDHDCRLYDPQTNERFV